MDMKYLLYVAILVLPFSVNGQTLLKDIANFPNSASGSNPSNWSAISEQLFIFQGYNLDINTATTYTLFVSDGTEAGTMGIGAYQIDTDIIRLGNRVYFGGHDQSTDVDSSGSIYVSDGTAAGTQLLFDPIPGGISQGIESIVAGDSLFFFAANTNDEGTELYRSNGTAAGTYRVADIAAGMESGFRGELAVIDDVAYFAGYTDSAGIEAWRSDGTAAGTYMIEDLNAGTGNGNISGFTASGGYIYFAGLAVGSGVEVRRTNGQQGNVELIGETGTTDSSWPRDFVDSDGRLYYAAVGIGSAGYDLYVYDHVGMPVHLDVAGGDIFPRALMAFGEGEVIFNADNEFGRELWHSDGTVAGTKMIKDLYPGPKDGLFPTGVPQESFYVWKDSLVYFAGADSVHAENQFVYELFVSDGTEAGTQLVSDQNPGPGGTNPGYFFGFGDRLYFNANDPVMGAEPYYLGPSSTSSIYESGDELVLTQLPYPNPVATNTFIHTEIKLTRNMEIFAQLYDLHGRPVQQRQDLGFFPTGNHHLQIKLDNHPSGLYHLLLTSGHDHHMKISFPIVIE